MNAPIYRAPVRRTNYVAPAPETYDDWLRINHPSDWASMQPEAVARYEDLQQRLRGMRADADDEAKYGRSIGGDD